MKGRIFCASQASTSICSSMDHIHKSTTTVDHEDEHSSSRAIDRHNPIIKDGRRTFADEYMKIPASAEDGEISNKEIYKGRRSITGRRSTGRGGGVAASLLKLITNEISLARKSFSGVARPACDFIKTPLGSTRYLLGSEPDSLSGSSGQDQIKTVATQPPAGEDKTLTEKKTCGGGGSDQLHIPKSRSLFSKCLSTAEAVKEKLGNICLECKLIPLFTEMPFSSYSGVTSFNIDFAAKKVTVTGYITPLEILDSISKVKNAQFWTTPTIPNPNLETHNP